MLTLFAHIHDAIVQVSRRWSSCSTTLRIRSARRHWRASTCTSRTPESAGTVRRRSPRRTRRSYSRRSSSILTGYSRASVYSWNSETCRARGVASRRECLNHEEHLRTGCFKYLYTLLHLVETVSAARNQVISAFIVSPWWLLSPFAFYACTYLYSYLKMCVGLVQRRPLT